MNQIPPDTRYSNLLDHSCVDLVRENNEFSIISINHSHELKEAINNGDFEDLFQGLCSTYRFIFGGSPWDEYSRCNNCKETAGITNIYNKEIPGTQSLLALENNHSIQSLTCGTCGSSLDYFYILNDLMNQVKKDFLGKIFPIFIVDKLFNVLGFATGRITTTNNLWTEKLSKIFYDLTSDAYQQILSIKEGEVFEIADWGIVPQIRGTNASTYILWKMLFSAKQHLEHLTQDDISSIGYVSENSISHRWFSKLGFKPLHKTSNSVLLQNRFVDIFNNKIANRAKRDFNF